MKFALDLLQWFLVCLAVCLGFALVGGMIWSALDGYPETHWGQNAP